MRAHAQIEGLWRLDASCARDNPVAGAHDLIELHVPEIDVERLRTILRYDRPLWDAMP